MTKLLSDIDVSRSFVVASFLELEAAARSCRCCCHRVVHASENYPTYSY